ncbi:alpha/beta hydrolase [Pseudomaricurvus alcaniphilus]|uniref:alpha/beta hydrolase n=1 Tax=Pseudomaricurvus alcaniphilus TaxID=1166482 RepID=UPI003132EFFF
MGECSEWFADKERRGLIAGACGQLEVATSAALATGPLSGAGYVAVVCHPHPQHGGTMDNKVASTLARTYRDLGVPVVRFNFRGVGQSEGQFADGVGELADLLAVIAWLQAELPGKRLLLAGFSFGSGVAAQAAQRLQSTVCHLVLVAPPVERYSYDQDKLLPCPALVIIGEQDELVDVPGVQRWVASLRSDCELITYADATHFFHGKLGLLKKDLASALEGALSA